MHEFTVSYILKKTLQFHCRALSLNAVINKHFHSDFEQNRLQINMKRNIFIS